MTNIASPEEILLHDNALTMFQNMMCDFDQGNVAIFNQHFDIKSNKAFTSVEKCVRKFQLYLLELKSHVATKKKNLKTSDSLKKNYNSSLNTIRQKIVSESCFKNLLFINDNNKFISHTESHFAQRVNLVGIADHDFIIGAKSNENTDLHILKLSSGRCGFETLNEMLSFLLNAVENSGIDDLIIKENIYRTRSEKKDGGGKYEVEKYNLTFMLNLPFGTKKILSSSPKIKHFLFGSNWDIERIGFDPKTCSPFVKTTLYHQYNVAVQKKLLQLIEIKTSDPNFGYITIKCCRTNPVCELVHVEKKCNAPKLFQCVCNMQLCGNGCGKVYHGSSSCDISLDEATEQMLASHICCPKCKSRIHKFDGCNHITCRCKTEFCYKCVQEYEIDVYGHYMVYEHHQKKCPQYE